MSSKLAPILLFVYNRPWHARQTLEALSKNTLAKESKLYIFADGPKLGASPDQIDKVKQVRLMIREQKWCGEVEIIERETNLGIEVSEVTAITEKINKYNRVIVLEDDHVTACSFLEFINSGLDLYEKVSNVYAINGHMFNIPYSIQKSVLLPFVAVWGWGTWKDKWEAYNPELKYKKILLQNKFLQNRFNVGDYDYISLLNHPDNPWDIRWYYSVFIKNGLCLFPTQSLVKNIGTDGSGTHYTQQTMVEEHPLGEAVGELKLQNEIDFEFYDKYINLFKKENISLLKRSFNFIKSIFKV